MENPNTPFELIIKSLTEKAPLKLDVYQNVENAFSALKSTLKLLESEISSKISEVDKRVYVKFYARGQSDLEFNICDDILIFSLHSDAFTFPESHQIWKGSYVNANNNRAYCGMISVYNFLTGSIKYNRLNDQGVLIARIFINHENHFFVEGKKQLGFLFNDFENAIISDLNIRLITETAILHCLEYDIVIPPFDQVKVISVRDMIEKSLSTVISTGKRLGFKLQSEGDIIK